MFQCKLINLSTSPQLCSSQHLVLNFASGADSAWLELISLFSAPKPHHTSSKTRKKWQLTLQYNILVIRARNLYPVTRWDRASKERVNVCDFQAKQFSILAGNAVTRWQLVSVDLWPNLIISIRLDSKIPCGTASLTSDACCGVAFQLQAAAEAAKSVFSWFGGKN